MAYLGGGTTVTLRVWHKASMEEEEEDDDAGMAGVGGMGVGGIRREWLRRRRHFPGSSK